MSIYTLAPLAGPALGPIAGGFIAENTSWRWVRGLQRFFPPQRLIQQKNCSNYLHSGLLFIKHRRRCCSIVRIRKYSLFLASYIVHSQPLSFLMLYQVFLTETYAPKILADKSKRLRKETGNDKLRTQWERPDRTLMSVIGHGLLRPVRIFATEPIVQVLGSYMAVLYGAFCFEVFL